MKRKHILVMSKFTDDTMTVDDYDGPGWYINGKKREIIYPKVVPASAWYIDLAADTHDWESIEEAELVKQSWWRKLLSWIVKNIIFNICVLLKKLKMMAGITRIT